MVQDTELFDSSYPTVLVVPMTGDPALAMADLTLVLQLTATNGCTKVSTLPPPEPDLRCVAKTRATGATESRITPAELRQLRQLVELAIGGINGVPGALHVTL